jgi:predicted aldo/keto reductase-like oxidoreductase
MERGVNFLDLFASDPVLRSNVGAAISGRRDKIIIQGHIGSAWQNGQYLRTRDSGMTKAAFEDQLERLGTNYIDVGMIHYVDSVADWVQIENSPFMEYVLSLKAEGKIHHIGLSSHNPDAAIAAVKSGHIEVLMFAVNPCYDMQPGYEDVEKLWADESYTFSLHNQNAARKQLYELCESLGVGIVVMKAYGGGDLLSAELSPFGKAFTPAQCIHYALTRPAVAAVVVGCKNTTQIDAALAYTDSPLSERDYSGVLSGLNKFTFSGHCLYCGHCAPCPVGIDVAAVTKYLNLCLASNLVPNTEKGHYQLLRHHAGECIACGQCEKNCPFSVKIIDNMQKAVKVFGF